MNRSTFHKTFKTIGPVVLPVIHVLDERQAANNIDIAMREGAQGVFLINHDFNFIELKPILVEIRQLYPSLWIGVNFLGVKTKDAFKHLSSLSQNGCEIDGYWADNAGIDERVSLDKQVVAEEIKAAREASGWIGLYFGGTAFKFQRFVDDQMLGTTAEYASQYMDVITTSGSGTGVAANIKRITDMRKGLGADKTLAIASGITPENVSKYASIVDCFLVATGISKDFHNFDPFLVRSLIQKTRNNFITISSLNTIKEKEDGWYLSLMGTIKDVTSQDTEVVLDPTHIYMNNNAIVDIIDDLSSCITPNIDLIVGINGSSGVPLATGIALKLKKGIVLINNTTADNSSVDRSLLKQAIKTGTRVVVIDTCIDKVDVINTVIELIEEHGGIVGTIGAICVKRNQRMSELCRKCKVWDVIPSAQREKYNQPFVKFC